METLTAQQVSIPETPMSPSNDIDVSRSGGRCTPGALQLSWGPDEASRVGGVEIRDESVSVACETV